MPVEVKREYVLTDNTGKTYVFSHEEVEKIKADVTVTLTCSGPRCQARNARPEPFTITWNEQELAKNPESLPDEFFKIIKIALNTSPVTELVFCGPSCVRDFLQYSYTPPISPREKNLRAKQEQSEKLVEMNPHLKSPEPSTETVPVAQADGDPGDVRVEYHAETVPATLPEHSGTTLKVIKEQE